MLDSDFLLPVARGPDGNKPSGDTLQMWRCSATVRGPFSSSTSHSACFLLALATSTTVLDLVPLWLTRREKVAIAGFRTKELAHVLARSNVFATLTS